MLGVLIKLLHVLDARLLALSEELLLLQKLLLKLELV